ncbi:MAG: glycerol-3-phosphate acyltransferase [Acidimicrobiia bacterium]
MSIWFWCAIPVAYMLGTLPSASMVARAKGRDIYSEGSGNPGASNVARLLGWKYGAMVFFLDFAKGAITAGVGLFFFGRPGGWALGIAAMVGHIAPVTRRFKGGKGVATGAGAMVVLFPIVVAILAAVWLLLAKGIKKASLASIVVAAAFPALALAFGCGWIEFGVLCVLAMLVIGRHAKNLVRLMRGEELSLQSSEPGNN